MIRLRKVASKNLETFVYQIPTNQNSDKPEVEQAYSESHFRFE